MGLICGGLGLIAALVLVFLSSPPTAALERNDHLPSWKAIRCLFDADPTVAELSSSLMDEGDSCCSQFAAKPHPVPGPLEQFKPFEILDANGNQSAPIPALTRLAPKRSPPAAKLCI
jgi:hypothetical protein